MFLATHGVLRREFIFVPTAFDSYSFEYDGVSDYFEGTSTYDELDTQNNFTFSFWIKPSNLTNDQVVFSIGNGAVDVNEQQFFFRLFATGQVYMYMRDLGKYARTSVGAITTNTWQHVLVCRDHSEAIGQKAKIFIDGIDATDYDGTRYWSNTTNATTGLMIGEHTNNQYTPFVGNIDELAIWDTDQRSNVSEIYGSGVAVDLNSLATAPSPITWIREENASWDGSKWTIDDENTSYQLESSGMTSSSKSTDVPTAPSFTNINSVAFDGILDYVDCGDNDNLSFGDGVTDSPFSISTWINIGNTKARGVVSKYGAIGTEWLFYMVGGKARLLLKDNINSATIFATGSTALTLNTWYHVGITYDGNGLSGINIYVNGSLETLTTSGSGYVAMSNTSQPLELGKYSTLEFLGKLDEVAIFNSELSSSDITTIYNAGVPNDISSLSPISWWRCGDGDTAPTLTDNGSGGNDGTMTNFSTFSTDVP